MDENKWTEEQWEAISGKDGNLLVAAAAGAGKTAVLVERIIRKIADGENPVDIDRLLVVTFTNAAAAEMRERIAEAISTQLERNPGSANIQRQLILLGKASITTIHSFCLEVVRANFQHINIEPGFRVADETESRLMKLEALSEVFEEQYEEENEEFFELLECYGGNRDDRALQDMVLDLYDFVMSSPWPEEWLEKMTRRLNVPDGTDFGDTPWGRALLSSAKTQLEGLREMILRALNILKDASGLEKYQALYEEDYAGVDEALGLFSESREAKWDDVYNALQNIEFAALPRCGKDVDRDRQEIAKGIRDDVKAGIKRLREKIIAANSTDIASDLKALYPKMRCLAGLVKLLAEKYSEKKSRKSVADFNDLEHFCLEILAEKGEDGTVRPSKAALGYRERFDEILVDEYQDSNLVQETIISMISRADSGEPNVFMVGDVKQSIYRFRQARPELFLEKYRTYRTDKGNSYRKILLFKNFRSRKGILDAVNFIFGQIMSAGAGELDYTDDEALHEGAVFEEAGREDIKAGFETELHIIQTGDAEEFSGAPGRENEGEEDYEADGDYEEPEDAGMLDDIQCEARLAGLRILELIRAGEDGGNFRVCDRATKECRKAEFRDIVILLRTVKNWADVFMEELSAMGIPAFADTGAGFFKTVEVQVALSLLQIIDNPLQDIPLLAVLRSPIAAFGTEELAEIRLADKKARMFDALRKLAGSGQGETARKAAAFLENLQKWREMSAYMPTDRLLWQLYNDTGYYAVVGAMKAGEQRQANLRMLFERARQFEETSYKGLFNFINFIDRLKSGKGDMGSAKILSENDNVVRIMSIHKSKGLEFPVVILAGCGKKFNLQDMNKSVLLHQDLGFGPDVADHKARISWPSAAKQAIRERIKTETLSEEMRILYVAMTRAREKLIITGAVGDAGKAAARWAACASVRNARLPAHEILKGCNYLDWMGPALIRHKTSGALREYACGGSGFDGLLIDDPSVWSIKIWNKSDVQSREILKKHEDAEEKFIRWLDDVETAAEIAGFSEEISGRLEWNYPYAWASRIPAKVSVTELKKRLFNSEISEEAGVFPESLPELIKKPKFMEERKGLTYAEKGAALHFVMQRLDFARGNIETQIEEMREKDLLSAQQAQSVDAKKIRRFLESPLGKRMLASGKINRETPFNIEMPCREIFGEVDHEACGGETVLLQGIIDCWFEEPDGIVLLDYKTDYVPVGAIETIKQRYAPQIKYYAGALEMLTGKRVKEKYIYLFLDGQLLEF